METRNPNYQIAEVFYRLNVGASVENDLIAKTFELIITNPNVKARDAQLGAFLTGLMVRGPSAREIVTLIRTALNIDGVTRYKPTLPPGEKLVGVAGSGKKGCKTFNISTPACLVASAAGAFVAKPGSSATSSISGSKDLMKMVGARITDPNEMIEILLETRFGLFPIEELIPKFDAVYGGKTFGPTPLSFAFPAMVNPIACDAVLYGLSHPNVKLALEVFVELGYENAMIVSSTPDNVHYIDELSVFKRNFVGRISGGGVGDVEELDVTQITQHPLATPEKLRQGDSLIENVQLAVNVLRGKSKGPHEDTVALNAAGVLVLAGKVTALAEGFNLAIDTIRSVAGFRKLEEFIEATGGSKKALSTITGG